MEVEEMGKNTGKKGIQQMNSCKAHIKHWSPEDIKQKIVF